MKAFFSSLIPSYIEYWERAFALKGETSRIKFWSAVFADALISVLIFGVVIFPILLSQPQLAEADLDSLVNSSWQLLAWRGINVIPKFTMEVRRVRDAGAKQWVLMLTASGLIYSIAQAFKPGAYPSVELMLVIVGLVPFAYTFAPSSGRNSRETEAK